MNCLICRITALLTITVIINISFAISEETNQIDVLRKRILSDKTEYRKLYNELMHSKYNFRIVGEIVDLDNKPVLDVSVFSAKSKGPMLGSFGKENFHVYDGKFDFKTQGAFSWGLTFKKAKYYPVTEGLGCSLILSTLDTEDGDYASLIFDGDTITRKVKIVLEPRGDQSNPIINPHQSRLTYSKHGNIKKLEVMIVPYSRVNDNHNNLPKDKELQFSYEKEKIYTLPKNLIYIIPGRNKDGSHDGTIRLKTTDPKGGFFPLEYKENEHFFRRMWEAPETGYQPEIIVKDGLKNYLQLNYAMLPVFEGSRQLMLQPKKAPFIPFYFKLKGYYGKGLIMPHAGSVLEKDKAMLSVHFLINIAPNIRNTNSASVNNNL
jgi:hypothetical protein